MTEHGAVAEIKRGLVDEAQTDAVGLWAVLWEVKQATQSASPDETRHVTLAVIRDALTEGHIVAGQFVDQDEETLAFSPWDLPVDETITRMDQEWAVLGKEPNLGDIVWFVGPHLLPLTTCKHPMGKDWQPS